MKKIKKISLAKSLSCAVSLLLAMCMVIGCFMFMTPTSRAAIYDLPEDSVLNQLYSNYVSAFGSKSSDNSEIRIGSGGWSGAEVMEIAIDNYWRFPTDKNKLSLQQTVLGFIKNPGWWGGWNTSTGWMNVSYNDDICWFIIGAMRAYEILGDDFKPVNIKKGNITSPATLKDMAELLFDRMFDRAWTPEGRGGLLWRGGYGYSGEGMNPTNPEATSGKGGCINFPAALAAALLYRSFGDGKTIEFRDYSGATSANHSKDNCVKSQKNYAEISAEIYKWATGVMRNSSTGQVNAGVSDWDWNTGKYTKMDNFVASYDHGTMVGAATYLYKATGDKNYIKDAVKTMTYLGPSTTGKYKNGVVSSCNANNDPYDIDSDGDRMGFEGIMFRWFGFSVTSILSDSSLASYWSDSQAVKNWMYKNAESAWKNRNDKNMMLANFCVKTPSAEPANPGTEPNRDTNRDAWRVWADNGGIQWKAWKILSAWECSVGMSVMLNTPKYQPVPAGGYTTYSIGGDLPTTLTFGTPINNDINAAYQKINPSASALSAFNAAYPGKDFIAAYRLQIQIGDSTDPAGFGSINFTYALPATADREAKYTVVIYDMNGSEAVMRNVKTDSVSVSLSGKLSFTVENTDTVDYGSGITYFLMIDDGTEPPLPPDTDETTVGGTTPVTPDTVVSDSSAPTSTEAPTGDAGTTAPSGTTVGTTSDNSSSGCKKKDTARNTNFENSIVAFSPFVLLMGGFVTVKFARKSKKHEEE